MPDYENVKKRATGKPRNQKRHSSAYCARKIELFVDQNIRSNQNIQMTINRASIEATLRLSCTHCLIAKLMGGLSLLSQVKQEIGRRRFVTHLTDHSDDLPAMHGCMVDHVLDLVN